MTEFTLKLGNNKNKAEEDFIKNADPDYEEEKDIYLPWKSEHVRNNARVGFNFRIKEPYHLKIKYLTEQKEISISKFLESIVYAAVDKLIEKDLKKKGLA